MPDADSSPVRPWILGAPRRLASTRVFNVDARLGTSASDPSKKGEFYRLQCAEWANVVAITPDRRVVLVEQFRFGTEEVTLEIPGGIVDEGESPAAACARELLEETGFAGDETRMIGRVSANPAIQNNRVHTGLILNAGPVAEANPDECEEIAVRLAPLEELPGLVRSGAIHHAFVVAAFHHLWLAGV